MLQTIYETRAWALESRYFSKAKATLLPMMQEGTLTTESYTKQKRADLPLPQVAGVCAAGAISAAQAFADFSAAAGGAAPRSSQVNVALIPLRGPMTKYGGSCSYGTKDVREWLSSALNNPEIGAVVMMVDSPGGAVDGTEDLAKDIKNAAKPVVSFVDGMAASAAYWAASQSQHIIINSATTAWVGSIGTLIAHMDQSAFLEKNGLKVTYITADASTDKVKGNSTQPLDEEAIAMFKADLNSINDTFISSVKAGRPGIADQAKWGTARIFNGAEGKKLGLVDAVGTLQDAIRKAAELATVKPKSSSKSNSNYNMKFATGFASSFPRLSAALGFSSASENVEVTEESLKTAEAAIEAALQAQSTAEAAKLHADGELATATAAIQTLTTAKTELEGQVATLETWKKESAGKTPPIGDESNQREQKKAASYNTHADQYRKKNS